MRIATTDLYLSIGPAPTASGRVQADQAFDFAPTATDTVRRALSHAFGPGDEDVHTWEEGDELVVVGPLELSADFSPDGEEAFMQAELEVDAELATFVRLLERAREVAPALWLAIHGGEELFLPEAFAQALRAGELDELL